MIPHVFCFTQSHKGIPRESGDDPELLCASSAKDLYSPRERG